MKKRKFTTILAAITIISHKKSVKKHEFTDKYKELKANIKDYDSESIGQGPSEPEHQAR